MSMGMGAALKLQQVVANTRRILAIELLAAAQGVDLLRPLRSSPPLERLHAAVRRAGGGVGRTTARWRPTSRRRRRSSPPAWTSRSRSSSDGQRRVTDNQQGGGAQWTATDEDGAFALGILAALLALRLDVERRGAAEHRSASAMLYWQVARRRRSAAPRGGRARRPTSPTSTCPSGIFRLELDLEYYADTGLRRRRRGGLLDRSAFVLVEFGLYAGRRRRRHGPGALADDVSDPFYAARLGWDFQLRAAAPLRPQRQLPRRHLRGDSRTTTATASRSAPRRGWRSSPTYGALSAQAIGRAARGALSRPSVSLPLPARPTTSSGV